MQGFRKFSFHALLVLGERAGFLVLREVAENLPRPLGERETGLAIQNEVLAFHRLYRSPCASATPRLKVLALAASIDMGGNTPIDFLLQDSDIELTTLFVVQGTALPSPLPEHDVAIVIASDSEECRPALAEIDALRSRPDHAVWLDIFDPGEADLALLRDEFDLHPLAIEDALSALQFPKIEVYDRYLYLVLHGVEGLALDRRGRDPRRLDHEEDHVHLGHRPEGLLHHVAVELRLPQVDARRVERLPLPLPERRTGELRPGAPGAPQRRWLWTASTSAASSTTAAGTENTVWQAGQRTRRPAHSSATCNDFPHAPHAQVIMKFSPWPEWNDPRRRYDSAERIRLR